MSWALVGLGVLVTLPLVIIGAGFLVMMVARPALGGRRPAVATRRRPADRRDEAASSLQSSKNRPDRPDSAS